MISDTLKELLKLPATERADLAVASWESLSEDEQDAEFVLSNVQKEELVRRLAGIDARPETGTPWEVVRDRIRNRR